MDREIALHFRDQLRDARATALKDAEAFEQVVFVLERIGVYVTGSIDNLATYADTLAREASKSPLADSIPSVLPDSARSILYALRIGPSGAERCAARRRLCATPYSPRC